MTYRVSWFSGDCFVELVHLLRLQMCSQERMHTCCSFSGEEKRSDINCISKLTENHQNVQGVKVGVARLTKCHIFCFACETLTTKCGGGSLANCFLLWAFWLFFFEHVRSFLLIQVKLLRISNLLFRLKYFPQTLFLPYHHLLWAF